MTLQEALPIVLPAFVGSALVALSVFVFRSGRGRVDNLCFSALYAVSGLKSLSESVRPVADAFHARAPAFPTGDVWGSAAVVCGLLLLPLLVLFLLLFPRPAPALQARPLLGFLLFLPSIVLGYLLAVQPWGIDGVHVGLALNVLALAGTLLATSVLVRTLQTSADPIERTRARYALMGFAPAFAGTWAVVALEFLRAYAGVESILELALVNFVTPFLELVAAAVTAYAILKYQLLGIELKVKLGARYVLVTVAVVSVLFVMNNYVGEFVLEPLFGFTEYYWAIAAAIGALLFRPVEIGAEWLTNRIFPETLADEEEYRDRRAADIYHAQTTYVLRDAQVSGRELAFLRSLRVELGLSGAEARRIEERVERILQVDSPVTGFRPRSRSS